MSMPCAVGEAGSGVEKGWAAVVEVAVGTPLELLEEDLLAWCSATDCRVALCLRAEVNGLTCCPG